MQEGFRASSVERWVVLRRRRSPHVSLERRGYLGSAKYREWVGTAVEVGNGVWCGYPGSLTSSLCVNCGMLLL